MGFEVPDADVEVAGQKFNLGSLADVFAKVAQQSPTEILDQLDNHLSTMSPIEEGVVNEALGEAGKAGLTDTYRAAISGYLKPYLADHQIDQGEIVKIVGSIAGLALPQLDPAPETIERAQALVEKYGVNDPGGRVSTGLAKAASAGGIARDMMKEDAPQGAEHNAPAPVTAPDQVMP